MATIHSGSKLSVFAECPLNQMYALARNLALLDQDPQCSVPADGKSWLLGLIREQMDPTLRGDFHGKVYELSPQRVAEWGWGEKHAFDDLNIVRQVIEKMALTYFSAVPTSSKNALFGKIYDLAGRPRTSDSQWGEHNATQDTERLIRALHAEGYIQDNHPIYLESYEKCVYSQSKAYHLNRKEPEHGRMGYVNGIRTNYNNALNDARRFSDNVLNGYNIHGVHADTSNDSKTDMAEILLQMSGTCTTPTKLIHETWNDFFKNAGPNELFYQFCNSKGAVQVNTAGMSYDRDLCKRIVVFAIAPAILMPKGIFHQTFHYIIPEDPIPYLLTNHIPEMKERISNKGPDIFILQKHEQGGDPHDLHCRAYQEQIRKDLQKFFP